LELSLLLSLFADGETLVLVDGVVLLYVEEDGDEVVELCFAI
jgi:hypothetical protein